MFPSFLLPHCAASKWSCPSKLEKTGVVLSFFLAKAWNVTPKILLLPFSGYASFPLLPLDVSPIFPPTENQLSWQPQSPAASQGSHYCESSWNQCFNLRLRCISQIQGWLFLQQWGSKPAPGAEAAFGAVAVPFSRFCVSLSCLVWKEAGLDFNNRGHDNMSPSQITFPLSLKKDNFPVSGHRGYKQMWGCLVEMWPNRSGILWILKAWAVFYMLKRHFFFHLYLVKG